MRAKGEREQVLSIQRAKSPQRFRIPLDGGAQIVRNISVRRAADRRIGRVPSPVSLRRVDVSLTMRRHAARGDQAFDVPSIDLTPHAPRLAG